MKTMYIALMAVLYSEISSAQSEYKDVAPIFYSRCATCHRPGGGAPFSLNNYSSTASEAYNIKNALQNNSMPPWSPDTAYTRFMHERIISASEKNTIINWIDAGTPAGDTTQAPAPPTFPPYKLFGTPSKVLQIPTYTSTANSNDIYVCFVVPTGLTQDRYLRAYEIIPGNPEIVHHVVTTVDTANSATTDLSGTCYNIPGDFGIGGYAPGAAPMILPGAAPLKAGIRIPKNSNIVMQMHYPQGTAGMVDSTQIRLYFYPDNETGIRNVITQTPLQEWTQLFIPPNTVKTVTAQVNVPSAVSVLSAFPHSHNVCTDIINYAYKNADTVPLIKVKWDFEWQGYYYYPTPVKIPAGYTLFSSHIYDNTANNPNVPNPNQWVSAGPNTNDEMLFDGFQWLNYQAGDDTINLAAIFAGDSLLNPAVYIKEKVSVKEISAKIYPNPNDGKFIVHISTPKISGRFTDYSLKIYNVLGEIVYQSGLLHTVSTIDLRTAGSGIYFVQALLDNEIITKRVIVTY